MRLLLDECVPRRLKRELPGHDARTVQDLGWAGIKNGALLELANGQFDPLLTVDQGIEYQQNLAGLTISVVVMVAPSNDVDDLRPLLPGVEEALTNLQPGEIIRVPRRAAHLAR
jgi:predicted nuclease of predicted toxin-antitoxin system